MKSVFLFLANGLIALLIMSINVHPVSLQQLLTWQRKVMIAISALRMNGSSNEINNYPKSL